eukprot:1213654-Prymnesium_polylepis.1
MASSSAASGRRCARSRSTCSTGATGWPTRARWPTRRRACSICSTSSSPTRGAPRGPTASSLGRRSGARRSRRCLASTRRRSGRAQSRTCCAAGWCGWGSYVSGANSRIPRAAAR